MTEAQTSYDVIIIGGGPAAYSAAIYAARGGFSTLVCAGLSPGGQLMITLDVENYPGFSKPILGPTLMNDMRLQVLNVGASMVDKVVASVDFRHEKAHQIKTEDGSLYSAKATIVATGASARWLEIESEKKFMGYGVSGCATCDGYFFRNKVVAVVGGGNSAAEEALHLAKLASKVYLIHRRDKMRCENILFERLKQNEKIVFLWDTVVDEIYGKSDTGDSLPFVTGVRVKNLVDERISEVALDGVFIAIGHQPNTAILNGWIPLDNEGYAILSKPGSTLSSVPGVFLAGDVADKVYRQAITAAATGCMAALDAARYLETS